MIRALTLSAVVLVSSGCAATLHSIDRGEWVLVTTDDGKGQELITKDAYAGEVVAGRERMVKLAVDEKAPVLHEAPEQLSATVGEFLRFRVNEGEQVDLLSDEAVAEVSWTTNKPVDGWNGDKAARPAVQRPTPAPPSSRPRKKNAATDPRSRSEPLPRDCKRSMPSGPPRSTITLPPIFRAACR